EYDAVIEKYLEKNGYIGITQTSGVLNRENLHRVPRYPMAQRYATNKGFRLKLNTLPLPVISTKEDISQNPPILQVKLKKHLNISCFLSSGEAIEVEWLDQTTFQTKAKEKLTTRREKYTCTAKADGEKWYWFSYLWILKD
ncbi:MAG: hypothetical protein ABXS93_04775, partial [Sulfurimonas sp.]